MPEPKDRTQIRLAISSALKTRGYSHEDVARILHKTHQTISNAISKANFSERTAREWSEALDIPIEVFLYGEGAPKDMAVQIEELTRKVDSVQKELKELKEKLAMVFSGK